MLQFFIAVFIAAFILFYFTCAAGLTLSKQTKAMKGGARAGARAVELPGAPWCSAANDRILLVHDSELIA